MYDLTQSLRGEQLGYIPNVNEAGAEAIPQFPLNCNKRNSDSISSESQLDQQFFIKPYSLKTLHLHHQKHFSFKSCSGKASFDAVIRRSGQRCHSEADPFFQSSNAVLKGRTVEFWWGRRRWLCRKSTGAVSLNDWLMNWLYQGYSSHESDSVHR